MSDLGTSDEDIRREHLRQAGEVLFEGNGAKLAAALGCSVDLISKCLRGKRSVTREMNRRVGELLIEQSIELERRAIAARELARRTLSPLGFLGTYDRLSGQREERERRDEEAGHAEFEAKGGEQES